LRLYEQKQKASPSKKQDLTPPMPMENLLDIKIMKPYYRRKGGRDKNEKNL